MDFDVRKYARLARIKLTPSEEKKISTDLGGILDYFKELEELNTDKIEPVIGGSRLKNVFREDIADETEKSVEEFPLSDGGYLKVPKILE